MEKAGEIQITLESLGHGPHAIGHLDGQAVFVRGGAPGDEVTARVTRRHARHLVAELVEILKPGPSRRDPPCPAYPLCGGCSWQHLDYPAQLAAKVANVRRELARLGGDVSLGEVIAAPEEWAYRRRVHLHVDPAGRVGFMHARSHRIVEIESCLIAEATVAAAIVPARRLVRQLRTPVESCDVSTRGELREAVLTFTTLGPLVRGDGGRIERFLAGTPAVSGIVLAGRGWMRTYGAVKQRVRQMDGFVELPPAVFTQANTQANDLLRARVVDLVSDPPPGRILELHAGAGNFTLALARHAVAPGGSVHAVERESRNAAALRRAARQIGQVTIERATAAAALARARASGEPFDVVVLDPPRTGFRDEAPLLLDLAPARIVAVSCDLATFGRDARTLLAGGYHLDHIDLVDLFPQTFHLELVARFRRT